MRTIKYLSPSSLSTWEFDQEEFYMKYLAEHRPPRQPQTLPMAVGSAFDAYVKAHIIAEMYTSISDKFELEALLKAQVDYQIMDEARVAGEVCFKAYEKSGALADLMLELCKSTVQPRFEFTAQGCIDGYREGKVTSVGTVPVLGKPDCHFITDAGAHVILDWKVNGYCSKNGASPKKHYVVCRNPDGGRVEHKQCEPMDFKGITINVGSYMEDVDEQWATQECTYGWLMGEPIGSDFIVIIDQLACGPKGIRVASHRSRVGKLFQLRVAERYTNAWETINSDHIFRDISKEDSATRCEMLDRRAKLLEADPVFASVLGRRSSW